MPYLLIFIVLISGVLAGLILSWLIRKFDKEEKSSSLSDGSALSKMASSVDGPAFSSPAKPVSSVSRQLSTEEGKGILTGRKNLGSYNKKRTRVKESRKKKIVVFLKNNKVITNDGTQGLLGVSDSTATSYLQELENEGKIIQQGKVGRKVAYILVR